MEYQNIINLLDNTSNHPSKIWTKNWVEINDDPRGTYNKDLKLQCWSQVYVIIAMHIFLYVEI